MSEEKTLSRRKFINLVKGAAAALGLTAITAPIIALFYPADVSETPGEPVPVGKPEDLPVGESRTVRFGRYPAIVVNLPDGLRAYSAVCTHFACIVKWDPDLEQLVCPCHEGYFDPADGSVISGPPPEPLAKLRVYEGDDGQLYISVLDEEEEA